MSKRLASLIERARILLEESEVEITDFPSAYEIHVFDFDKTLHHEYKPLPCVEIMRDLLAAGVPCYIVTARKPDKGQEQHICDVLYWWDINFEPENVFAVGADVEKGPFVRELVQRHESEKCTFWDDKDYNCDSVFNACCDIVDELSIYQLSAAIPGDVRKEITKDENNQRVEIKHILEERKSFRNWRRLSKIN